MLQRIQTLNISITDRKEIQYMAKTKKEITKNLFSRKRLFLAAFLSLLCSSSTACAADVSVGTNAINTPTVMLNKQPFFPFGFYYTSWSDQDDTKRLLALRKIADAGFNVIHASLDLNDGQFVDEAARRGVYIIGEFNDDTMSVINKYKNNPAIMGWLVADDADNGKKTADDILKFHKQVKAADPQRITYLSGGYPSRIGQFANTVDVIGMQSYPIGNEPLSSTDYTISTAVKAAAPYNRPVIANLQAFAWNQKRQPSSKEVRNMTYQALIDGVKGITYYAYHDRHTLNWDMTNYPNLWNGIKSLVPEIKQLSPMLLNGNLTKIHTGVYDIFAGMWHYQNQAVVVVINTSSSTKHVSIALPSQRPSQVKAMFSGRPSGMTVIGNKLSGSIKPKDVHVYSFGI